MVPPPGTDSPLPDGRPVVGGGLRRSLRLGIMYPDPAPLRGEGRPGDRGSSGHVAKRRKAQSGGSSGGVARSKRTTSRLSGGGAASGSRLTGKAAADGELPLAAPSPPRAASNPSRAAADASLPAADYRHKTSTRKNNPPAKIAAEGTVPAIPKARYAYSPHLAPVLRFDPSADADRAAAAIAALIDKAGRGPLTEDEAAILREALDNREPWLEWAGKREQHERGHLEVDPVALHIHERVSAQAILKIAARQDVERSLFADPEQEYHEAVQFYRHDIDWTNRVILGDSLQVMSSLARREDLAGKVQMIYMDPPYGIKFASNFQSQVGKREVKDKENDLTREPEMVKAYRDTWHLGIHSYLAYLRDRLIVARELLADTGSIFVQISDENVHRVRHLLEDIFGSSNFVTEICFAKTTGQTSSLLAPSFDILLWFARDRQQVKYKQLHREKSLETDRAGVYRHQRLASGEEVAVDGAESVAGDVFRISDLRSQSGGDSSSFSVDFSGQQYRPAPGFWKTNARGMDRLLLAERTIRSGRSLGYVRFIDDFAAYPHTNYWGDTGTGSFTDQKVYVVQTGTKVIERCMLMTTDPGDLVLDPTCGSGTTAYVAEQWGRRWITIDTSRVALAIARQRLLTAKFDYHQLRPINDEDQKRNPAGPWLSNGAGGVQGPCTFKCRTVPHITLRSIAQNANLDPIFARHEPILDDRLARCNAALAKVTDKQRAALAGKLAAKIVAEGWRAPTDADYRRWILPGATRAMIESALASAFAGTKKSPTKKQVAALTERIPARVQVGPSSVAEGGTGWEHWQVPFDTDPDWPAALSEAVSAYRQAWRAKMDEVNACIAANADQEELVDQPETVKGVTRVSGPFTVEAVQPPEMSLGEVAARTDDPEFAGAPEALDAFHEEGEPARVMRIVEQRDDVEARNAAAYLKQMFDHLHRDGVRFLGNRQMAWSRLDPLYESGSGEVFHAEGRWTIEGEEDADPQGRANVVVVFGPQYGPVTAKMVEQCLRAAARAQYDDLVIAGFSFDGAATSVIDEVGGEKGLRTAGGHRLRVHMANIRPDVNPGMNGLLKEQPGSQLFTVFGQPRVRVNGPGRAGSFGDLAKGEPPEGEFTVTMEGVDLYDPVSNEVIPTNADKVAAWFLDSDYDGRTFCISQAFFPDRSAWEKLSRALNGPGGPIDAEKFEAFSGTTSLPFPKGRHATAAVKVIDPRGNEVMRVERLG